LNRSILVSFYSAMTTELVLVELLCCDCECVFCNSLVFYVSVFYFILWAVVSTGYSALLSSSYFERINDDDDDEYRAAARTFCTTCSNRIVLTLRTTEEYETSQGRAGQPRGGHHTVRAVRPSSVVAEALVVVSWRPPAGGRRRGVSSCAGRHHHHQHLMTSPLQGMQAAARGARPTPVPRPQLAAVSCLCPALPHPTTSQNVPLLKQPQAKTPPPIPNKV